MKCNRKTFLEGCTITVLRGIGKAIGWVQLIAIKYEYRRKSTIGDIEARKKWDRLKDLKRTEWK